MVTGSKNSTPESDWHLHILTEKRYRIHRHTFSLLLLLFILLTAKMRGEFHGFYDILDMIIGYCSILAYFYINMYVLIPKFFYQKRPVVYFLSMAVLISTGFVINYLVRQNLLEPHRAMAPRMERNMALNFLFGLAVITPFLLSSTALKLFQRWIADTNRLNELETKALESELTALRNQINPHFLFNMLNNVNVLTRKDPQKASLLLVKFSDFLRYQLYENNASHVLLSSEIKFINDFLNLEQVRRDNFNYHIPKNNPAFLGVGVPPNIFITFVENAVKHSADSHIPSSVTVDFALQDNRLTFTCINTKPPKPPLRLTAGGIGLTNTIRRLELLFQEDYSLHINDTKEQYEVTLIIPI